MRNSDLLIRLQRSSGHIRELVKYGRGTLCRIVNGWEAHWRSISILKRLGAWVLMARGRWIARSSEWGMRTESRVVAIKIGWNVIDHRWWETWMFCGSWSNRGLRRLLTASTLVELVGCFINR